MPSVTNRRRERGQSLVELALSLPVLLLILSGLLDLGRVYFTYIALEDAAAEGALYLAVNPDCEYETSLSSAPKCEDPNNGEFRVYNSIPDRTNSVQVVDWNRVTYTPEVPSGCTVSTPVTVSLEYDYNLVTPVITAIAGDLTLRTSATQIIIAGKCST